MVIENIVQQESLNYTDEKPDLLCRSDEIGNLGEIYNFCVKHNEKWIVPDGVWEVEIEDGVTLLDWIYFNKGKGKFDDRSRLMRYFTQIRTVKEEKLEIVKTIEISLGEYGTCSFDMESYYKVRRKILTEVENVGEFIAFMDSCFDKILFSDDIESPLRAIPSFTFYVNEIVAMLSELNDKALKIFTENHDNPKKAMDEMTAQAGRTCAPETKKHEKYCNFSFTIEKTEEENGEKEEITKSILCSPHLKLIHDGSNLRIYFNWNDSEFGKGEKILVGRIGSHPYKK